MKNKIFISHKSPEDNDFTKWLAIKLIGLGYDVWCDVLFLEKGTDFWNVIENEIRENTCTFLLILSSASNKSSGVANEIAVANHVKKKLNDDTFIIPLIVDETLSHDDIKIEIARLDAINFTKSWAVGLQELIRSLEKRNIPKSNSAYDKSNLLYQQIFQHNKGIIDKEEQYDSNWFPIVSFPNELRFHEFGDLVPKTIDFRRLNFPAVRFKNYFCTFAWEYDFMHSFPKTETYDNTKTIRISTLEILSGKYNSPFISNSECQRLIVQLINRAFELTLIEKKLKQYILSYKIGYWIEKGKLEKDKFNKVQLVGKQKDKTWHFGISGASKLYPFPVFMISSHVFFTYDGNKLIEKNSIQHAARRRQGKNWWNNDWRNKLLAFMMYLSDEDNSLYLEVGSEEKIQVLNIPIQFTSKVSYNIPEKNTLNDEVELSDLSELDSDENINDEIS